MALDAASIGPVEYALVAFPGNRFNGEIAPALAQAVGSGAIRIIDLVFVVKNADGSVESLEIDALPAETVAAFDHLDGEISGLLSEQDIGLLAADLEPGSSAALLVWEAAWAAHLATAVRESGGELLARETLPRETVLQALAALPA
ncbi:hypothetical protein KDL01_38460 [Actinospica durhamensis]|uniref:DUF1269 domain-containing protein n=1 Tax=Actinospica durhamensis TaxID=1508375 RepID=A0A941F1F8_9ACTN|nr:DUF6325 family protein [Actinospica durhamensis]MBR7839209.1 hypothetical protein [Actinospica durhamensis]